MQKLHLFDNYRITKLLISGMQKTTKDHQKLVEKKEFDFKYYIIITLEINCLKYLMS